MPEGGLKKHSSVVSGALSFTNNPIVVAVHSMSPLFESFWSLDTMDILSNSMVGEKRVELRLSDFD